MDLERLQVAMNDSGSVRISKGQGISSREIKGQGAFSIKIGHFASHQIKTEKFT
jgi:hypothetical protein